jgi:hypothetical protein
MTLLLGPGMFTHDPGSVPTLLHPPKQIQYRPCWRGRFWCIGRGEGEGIRMLGVLQRDYTDTAAGDNLLKELNKLLYMTSQPITLMSYADTRSVSHLCPSTCSQRRA